MSKYKVRKGGVDGGCVLARQRRYRGETRLGSEVLAWEAGRAGSAGLVVRGAGWREVSRWGRLRGVGGGS